MNPQLYTRIKNIKLLNMAPFSENRVFCPICSKYFPQSEHLKKVIGNQNTLWVANMVTHYRHSHIRSWNRCWDDYSGRHYRSGWFSDYETEKEIVNERAKRQIMRKCLKYLKEMGFSIDDLQGLQSNSDETIKLFKKLFI